MTDTQLFAPKRYIKKPVEVEVFHFMGYTLALAPYPYLPEGGELWQWLTEGGCKFGLLEEDKTGRAYLEIYTLEGVMRADVGDYIIKGVAGEFYPCKADIFEQTYERLPETLPNEQSSKLADSADVKPLPGERTGE